MNSLLLILLLGASVALAELPFDHPEFLNEEREEFLGEPADEENDSHRPRPSGTPVPIMRKCKEIHDECEKNAQDKPCGIVSCRVGVIKCIKEKFSSQRPTSLPSRPPKAECIKEASECLEKTDGCKGEKRCLTRFDECRRSDD